MKLILNIIFIILALILSIALFMEIYKIIIFGFIILFIDLLLMVIINKNITKSIKIILIPIISVILLLNITWTTILLIDINNFENMNDPIFAKEITGDRYYQKYDGLGYEIRIENGYNPETKKTYKLKGDFYLFGKLITAYIS